MLLLFSLMATGVLISQMDTIQQRANVYSESKLGAWSGIWPQLIPIGFVCWWRIMKFQQEKEMGRQQDAILDDIYWSLNATFTTYLEDTKELAEVVGGLG